MYNLFRIVVIISRRLPNWSIEPLARIGGLLFWLFAHGARRQVTENMVHVLGEETVRTGQGRRRLRRTVQGVFQNSVRNYLQVFRLPVTPAHTIMGDMNVTGIAHLEAALARGKGVILFAAHLGPFDYLSQWMGIQGYDLTIPVEHLQDQRMLDLMLALRRSHGVNFLPLGGSAPLRAVLQALRNNKIVLFATDRAVVGESIEMPFFGELARLPFGPATLAARSGATVVGAFGWRTHGRDGQPPIEGRFSPLTLTLSEEQRTDATSIMKSIVDRMERQIREHPEQWMVFSPIWKHTTRGEA